MLIKKIITGIVRNIATQRIVFTFIVFPLLRLLALTRSESVLKHTGERDVNMIDRLPGDWFTAFTSFQAKFGIEALSKIDANDKVRAGNVNYIKNNTSSTRYPSGVNGSENVYWQLLAYFESPKETQEYFHSNKIDTSTTSLVKISTLQAYPYQGITPNADRLYANGFFIPSYPGLSKKELAYICHVLNNKK